MRPDPRRLRLLVVLALLLLLATSAACDLTRTPRLAPDQLGVNDQAAPLQLGGLDPADYLDPHGGRLGLADDFVAVIGGAPTSVLGADGAGVTLRLGRPLPVGAHDLELTSAGRRWTVVGALRVVGPGGPDGADGPGPTGSDAPDGGAGADARPLPSCPGNGSLIACYPFEGDTRDQGPNQLDAVASGVAFAPGPLGSALDLEEGSRVEVADAAALDSDDLTLQAWIFLRARPTTRAMIVDNHLQYGLWVNAAGLLVCSAGRQLNSPAAIPLATWVHVACTHDPSNVHLYVDGAEVNSGAAQALSTQGSTGLSIGGDNPLGADDRFDGLLDELRLYRVARSPAELCVDAGQATCP